MYDIDNDKAVDRLFDRLLPGNKRSVRQQKERDAALIVEKKKLRARNAWPSNDNAAIYNPFSHANPFPPASKHDEFLSPPRTLWILWERIGHTPSMLRSSTVADLGYALALHNLFTVSGKRCLLLRLTCKCGKCKHAKMQTDRCTLEYITLREAKELLAVQDSKIERQGL